MGRLIIDGNRVYEIDEVCMQKKRMAGRSDLQERKRCSQNQSTEMQKKKNNS